MIETWQIPLKAAGFPTTVLLLDFESYFDKQYGMSAGEKLSTVEFVCDKRFEVTGIGVQAFGDGMGRLPHCVAATGKRTFLTPHDAEMFLDLLKGYEDEYTLAGQNLPFDALVLREKYGLNFKYTVDIIDLSRHRDARDRHNLEYLAVKYHAPIHKGDTKQFMGMHWDTMTVGDRQRLMEYCLGDIEIEEYLLKLLLPLMTRPEVELRLAAQTLRMFLVPQVQIDAELGRELLVGMTAELQQHIDRVNSTGVRMVTPAKVNKRINKPPRVELVTVDDISKDGSFLRLLAAALPGGESIPMKQGKVKLIPALAKTDTQLDFLLSHPKDAVRALVEARKATDSWPGHISRIRNLLAQSAVRGGWLGMPLRYYGAHTGRWSGTGGINPQNFGARDVHPLVKQVGAMIKSPEGFTLAIPDLSQIEARVVAWFAGQEDLLQAFAEGRDIYSEFAGEQIYHKDTRKPRKDDPPELYRELDIRRSVGKETILGAGFGMGGQTFYDRCCEKSSLKNAVASGDLTLALSKQAIAIYRQRYSMIPKLWKEVESAWRFVAKYQDQVATVSHYGRSLNFWNENGTVVIQLPSGRCIFYPHAGVTANGECRYHWGKLYGGAITENVVQAAARDVFGEALLRLEDHLYNSLFSVHDADVMLIPLCPITEVLVKDVERLMTVRPVWAQDLPVAVESKVTPRFKK